MDKCVYYTVQAEGFNIIAIEGSYEVNNKEHFKGQVKDTVCFMFVLSKINCLN